MDVPPHHLRAAAPSRSESAALPAASSPVRRGLRRCSRAARCASWGCRTFSAGTTTSGFDCSGFVQHVFAMLGHRLPRTADAQYDVGHRAVGGPQPGDLVFFDTYGGVSHVGIYLGERQVRSRELEPRRDGEPPLGIVLGGPLRWSEAPDRHALKRGRRPPADNAWPVVFGIIAHGRWGVAKR